MLQTTLPATVRCPYCGWAGAAAAEACSHCGGNLPAFDSTLHSYERTAGKDWPRPPTGIRQGGTLGGRYRLGPMLGCGGAAMVFEALDMTTRRGVAAKVLLAKYTRVDEAVRRFRREADVQAKLHHPSILAVLDFVTEGDNLAIVSELARGPSLAQRIDSEGALPVDGAVRLFLEVVGALDTAHALDVVHRDLKPSNILFDRFGPSGCAKVADFGLAKVLSSTEKLTHTGTQMGTPWYMAPEQCRSARRADARTDIYSLGVTMFHALTGRVPFDGKQPWEVADAHQRTPPPDPSRIRPGIPPLLSAIVLQCLAKDPSDRFQSASAVRQALHALSRTCPPTPRWNR
ncbi:MAG: protein kinase [Deltaproteobacteria bacterium]|nr:protein kinase [Deltaproteobacteria bacterium]